MQKLTPSKAHISDSEQQRVDAQNRLTLYLQALDLPPADVRRLSAQALDMAQASSQKPLLSAAMESLQLLLDQQELPQPPMSRPPRRQSMVPEPLERSLPGLLMRRTPSSPGAGSLLLQPALLVAATLAAALFSYYQIG